MSVRTTTIKLHINSTGCTVSEEVWEGSLDLNGGNDNAMVPSYKVQRS